MFNLKMSRKFFEGRKGHICHGLEEYIYFSSVEIYEQKQVRKQRQVQALLIVCREHWVLVYQKWQ